MNTNRQPKGSPIGGQFAPGGRDESADLDLSAETEAKSAEGGYFGEIKDRDERVEAMKADLANAVNDIVASGQLSDYLDAVRANRANHWSANNRILAGVQLARREGLKDPADIIARIRQLDCGSFKQWKERGRQVTSGPGSALYIYAPVTRKITEEDPERPGKERQRTIMVGFKPMATFDVSQTDGDPVPQHPSKPFTGEVAAGTVEAFSTRAEELGYTPSREVIPGCDPVKLTGTLAYVDPKNKRLVVDARLTDEQASAAMAHELGHIECGHADGDYSEYVQHRGRMETEAESFAYMMMRERGAEPEEAKAFSPGYIAGWSKGETKTVTSAIDKASKAFRTSYDAMFGKE